MNINTQTTLFYDKEEQTMQDKNNKELFDRMINTRGLLRNNYNIISNNVGLYQTNRSGMLRNIDNESNLLNGKVGNVMTCNKDRSKKILPTRIFPGTPLKKSTIHKEMNADVSSKLLQGKLITKDKRTSKLSGVSIDRFIPLVKKFTNHVQDSRAENTRNNLRSMRQTIRS